jgi:hypothetical protein
LTRPPVPSSRCLVRSRHRPALPTTGLGFGLPAPQPASSGRRQQDLPSSRQILSMHALLSSDPGGTGAPGHLALAMLPSAPDTASAPTTSDFGAQSLGLHLRCLRFAVTVTRTPRKTRFRAVASLTRAGLDPQDLFGKFPSDSSHVISSPFPELCSAHARHLLLFLPGSRIFNFQFGIFNTSGPGNPQLSIRNQNTNCTITRTR